MCTAFFMYAFGTIEKERAFNERVKKFNESGQGKKSQISAEYT